MEEREQNTVSAGSQADYDGRIFMDADFRLIFHPAQVDDTAPYSCWSWDGMLLLTADMAIEERSKVPVIHAYVVALSGGLMVSVLLLYVAIQAAMLNYRGTPVEKKK